MKGGHIISVEENKAIVRRMYQEIHNKGNMAAVDELLATNFVDHHAPGPGIAPGPEGIKQTFTTFRTAFPDFHATVEDMIAEGDKVVGDCLATLFVIASEAKQSFGYPRDCFVAMLLAMTIKQSLVARLTISGTHKGELQGTTPTDKQVTITSIIILRFAGGKIAKEWEVFDELGMMQQLGVVPPPGQA